MKIIAIISALTLTACTVSEPDVTMGSMSPSYVGIETRLLDGDLINFRVAMTGATSVEDVTKYAECAVARYTLIRGYGFLRHVRTQADEDGGLWSANAVYKISPSLPRGLKTIDAEVAVADCGTDGIPTV